NIYIRSKQCNLMVIIQYNFEYRISNLANVNHFLQLLKTSFAPHGQRPALVLGGRTISYGALDVLSRRAAASLQGHGVGPGARVVLCTPDKLAFLLGHLGALWAGAVSLPLNPRFTREELRFSLTDSGARLA